MLLSSWPIVLVFLMNSCWRAAADNHMLSGTFILNNETWRTHRAGVFFHNVDKGISTWTDPRRENDLTQRVAMLLVAWMPVAIFTLAMVCMYYWMKWFAPHLLKKEPKSLKKRLWHR